MRVVSIGKDLSALTESFDPHFCCVRAELASQWENVNPLKRFEIHFCWVRAVLIGRE